MNLRSIASRKNVRTAKFFSICLPATGGANQIPGAANLRRRFFLMVGISG
jgi:hypothetical protein